MRRYRAVLAALVGFCVLIAGCERSTEPQPTSAPSSQQTTHWPDALADFRFRWTADPGVDLETGNAVPIRAYLESWLVIAYTENVDNAYPGYLRATPVPLDPASNAYLQLPLPQQRIRQYFGTLRPGERVAGNEDLHLLRIEPMDTGFRAFVCDATYRVYRHAASAKAFKPLAEAAIERPNRVDAENMYVWRIEFTDHDPRVGQDAPAAPTTPQKGPLPAPRDDVFGPWFITGSQTAAFWWQVDHPGTATDSAEATRYREEGRTTADNLRQECLDRYPVKADERVKLATTIIDEPPPVEPAEPGWPE